MRVASVAFFLLLSSTIASLPQKPQEIELEKGQAATTNGFRLRIEVGPQHFTSSSGASFDLFWFSLFVPRKIGETNFCGAQLTIEDKKDCTLLSVPLHIREGDPNTDTALIDVQIQSRFARGCKVRFRYCVPPMDYIGKEYVVSIVEHLPPKR